MAGILPRITNSEFRGIQLNDRVVSNKLIYENKKDSVNKKQSMENINKIIENNTWKFTRSHW